MTSRGTRETPRQEADRTKKEQGRQGAARLNQQFRDAASKATENNPSPPKRSRRRTDGETQGGFRLSATQLFRRSETDTRRDTGSRIIGEFWSRATGHQTRNQASETRGREEASSGGELINWYLSLGYKIDVIRAMFPGLFTSSPSVQTQLWDTLDWVNPYWGSAEAYAEIHVEQHHHLSP
jgi:hypothetical protein